MTSPITWPTSVVLTKGQRISKSSSQALFGFTQSIINNYNLFWTDPINIAAEWGNTAVSIFQDHATTVAYLVPQLQSAGAPQQIIDQLTAGIPSSWNVVYNQDGTVTITAVAPPTPTPTPAPTPRPTPPTPSVKPAKVETVKAEVKKK